jgi:ligand-binding sensor domain-containing protein
MKNPKVMVLALSITAAAMIILLLLVGGTWASPALQEARFPAAVAADQTVSTWNSGWVDIGAGTALTLTHDVGGVPGDYAVELWFRDAAPGGLGIHQRGIGGIEAGNKYYGAYWQNLTNSTIQVVRLQDDILADQVYVQIRTPDPPAWDSNWQVIAPGTFMTLTHSVGGNRANYTVALWFRDTTAGGIGINTAGYGGLEMAGLVRGASWQDLTNTTIGVRRYPDDTWADQVRVRIYIPEPPAWDSDWVDINAGTVVTLAHGLGGDPNDYVIQTWHRDTNAAGIGVNHQFAGGCEAAGKLYGASWQNLTGTTINVFRFSDDWVADQVRVRIWAPSVPQTATPTATLLPSTPTRTPTLTPTRTVTPTVTATATGVLTVCVPSLLSPAPGAVMDNGRRDYQDGIIWDFDWSDCPGATAYHLYVIGPTSTLPQIDRDTLTGSNYQYTPLTYITDANRIGWTWKVQAKVNNQWGAWSEIRTFDVEPVDTDGPSITVTPTATRTATLTPTRTATPGPPPTPGGHWQSWTNGNHVRDLALTAGVLWAGTEGGALRWDPVTAGYIKYLAPDGLQDGDVRAVAPSASGVTWFGTWGGGLVGYDGAAWTPFTTTQGLPSNYVQGIALEGNVKWVGTDYGLSALDDGATLSNRADDQCTTFRTMDGLSDNYVRAVARDSSNRKWVATYRGLSVLDDGGTPHDKTNDTWATFNEADGLVEDYVYTVLVDAQNRVWAGTGSGLSVLDFAGTPFIKTDDTWTTFGTADGLADDDVYDLALDSQGRVWIATYGGGIFVLDPGGTPFVKTDDTWTQFSTSDGLASTILYALVLDEPSQQVWAGTWGAGISRLSYAGTVSNKGDDTWTTFATTDPLPDNLVYPPLSGGDLAWFGTYGGGLVATDARTWTTFTTASGLASNYAYALAAEGSIKWVGTSSGVSGFDDSGTPHDKADDQWATFHRADGLWTESIYDVDVDPSGRLWAACSPSTSTGNIGGLSVLDDGGTPFDKADDLWMSYVTTDTNGVFNGYGYQMAMDGTQRVWIGGMPAWDGSKYLGGGLVLLNYAGTPFDKSDDTWTVFTTTHGLPYDYVYAVALDSAGRVWAGTFSGLSVLDYHGTPFDKADDTWTQFRSTDGLVNSTVTGITLDPTGRLWLATTGGLSLLDTHGTPHDKADDVWTSWRVSNGLVDSNLTGVAIDQTGAVWAGTSTGLSRMTTATRVYLPIVVRNHP